MLLLLLLLLLVLLLLLSFVSFLFLGSFLAYERVLVSLLIQFLSAAFRIFLYWEV